MRFFVLTIFFITCIYAKSPYGQGQKQTIQQVQIAHEFDAEFKTSEDAKKFDPLSGYNRIMTNFNDFFILNILNPVSKGYKTVLLKPARIGISNFFDNLMYPLRLVNNLLQFKFKNSYNETQRFILNSTIGIVGFIDVANNSFDIKEHTEDFGQTLGYYGMGSGFSIVWPLLGPSNLRDSIGFISDSLINPLNYMPSRNYNLLSNDTEYYSAKTFEIINHESLHVGEYENLKKDAIDLYPFLQNIYEQRRNKMISE